MSWAGEKRVHSDNAPFVPNEKNGGSPLFVRSPSPPPSKSQISVNELNEIIEKCDTDVLKDVLKEQFLKLSDSRISTETMCLMIIALRKAIFEDKLERRNSNDFFVNILSFEDNRTFLTDHLPLFITDLNQHFTSNRPKFTETIQDLLLFLQRLLAVFPADSLDIIRTTITTLKVQIDSINKNESCIPDSIVTLLNEIKESVKKAVEEKVQDSDEKMATQPNNYRNISITPTDMELFAEQGRFLRKNIIQGKYDSTDHYLDVQFRLLHEDFTRGLREGINEYMSLIQRVPKESIKRSKDINVFNSVRIADSETKGSELVYNVSFDVSQFRNVYWQNSKKLLQGSLLCLSDTNFKTFFVAVVADRNPNKLQLGQIQVKFQTNVDSRQIFGENRMFTMVESQAFFEAYRYNLEVLQRFNDERLPFQKYIVNVEQNIDPPEYLKTNELFDLSGNTAKLVQIPTADWEKLYEIHLETTNIKEEIKKLRPKLNDIIKKLSDNGRPRRQQFGRFGPDLDENYIRLEMEVRQLKCEMSKLSNGAKEKNRDIDKYFAMINLKQKSDVCPEKAMVCNAVKVLDDAAWPDESIFGMDRSQYDAFRAALTKEFVLIQGPPGTGKTYVGLRIVQALLQNINPQSPILIVCYTNHALDQFLAGIIPYCTDIARIGGSSKNKLLSTKFNLTDIKRNSHFDHYKELSDGFRSIQYEISTVTRLEKELDELKSPKKVLKCELRSCISKFNKAQYTSFKTIYEMEEWLGYSLTTKKSAEVEKTEHDKSTEALRIVLEKMVFKDDKDATDGSREATTNMVIEEEKVTGGTKEAAADVEYFFGAKDEKRCQLQKQEEERLRRDILIELRKTDCMSNEEAHKVIDVWSIGIDDRWRLYRFWVKLYSDHLLDQIDLKRGHYLDMRMQLNEIYDRRDVDAIRGKRIIGMTTTGAAKYRHVIDGLEPQIIIVEEAAEVLEAHIVTSLCSKTKQLILIGDHQQLQPNPTVYELAKKYSLETSLFERMINNGIEHFQLKLQHRMRPEISALLVPHIYEELLDHASVYDYEVIKGVPNNMFFLNHHEMENEISETMSHLNIFEAEFVVQLSRYLILQGYQSNQVTILTMYSGQLMQIRKLMKQFDELKYVRATVVDNFQGEESDIIILSFVRSNDHCDIGFLKVANRVNVALSRAKKGLFCVGNFNCLARNSDIWKKIVAVLEREKAIGDSMKFVCQNHPDTITHVRKGSDFMQVPEGGCMLRCESLLPCGHVCPKNCHVIDSDHLNINCSMRCDKPFENCENEHQCQKVCHFGEECGPCPRYCKKTLSCGHKCELVCSKICYFEPCVKLVEIQSPCGHTVMIQCHLSQDMDAVLAACKNPCGTILECKHECNGTCGDCYQGRLHLSCQEKCERSLVCGHKCQETCAVSYPPCQIPCPSECGHSKCQLPCGEPCAPCEEPCTWKCAHFQCSKLCHEPCGREICREPCQALLECSHTCIGLCGETCPKFCRICDEEIVKTSTDKPEARFVQLNQCGHLVEIGGLLNWLERKEDSIEIASCPICHISIRNSTFVKKVNNTRLMDNEGAKTLINQSHEKQMALHLEIANYPKYAAGLPNLMLCKHLLILRNIYQNLLRETEPTEKNVLAQLELQAKENMFKMWSKSHEIFAILVKALNNHNPSKAICTYTLNKITTIKKIATRLLHFLNFLNIFTANKQQYSDARSELDLLSLVAEMLESDLKHKTFDKNRTAFEDVFQLALQVGRCSNENLEVIKTKIHTLEISVLSPAEVLDNEG